MQIDYLGSVSNSKLLIEKIQRYYFNRGIPLIGAKFQIIEELDQWGTRMYSVRSNIKWDVKSQSMKIDTRMALDDH